MTRTHSTRRRSGVGRRVWGAASLGLALTFSGCGVSGLGFQVDDRVEMVSPPDRSTVELPATVRWTADADPFGSEGGSYGVLVDRDPPPPGRPLAWLFRGRDDCAGAPGCPTIDYMKERGAHITKTTSLTIENVTDDPEDELRKFHEVTVVILDAQGNRVGEGAWFVRFEVRGEQ